MRLSKSLRFKKDSAMRVDLSVEGENLLNRTNYAAVNEILPVTVNAAGQITSIAPDYNFGTTRLTGRLDRDFRKNDPLSFTSSFNPRQILFGAKFAF